MQLAVTAVCAVRMLLITGTVEDTWPQLRELSIAHQLSLTLCMGGPDQINSMETVQ